MLRPPWLPAVSVAVVDPDVHLVPKLMRRVALVRFRPLAMDLVAEGAQLARRRASAADGVHSRGSLWASFC